MPSPQPAAHPPDSSTDATHDGTTWMREAAICRHVETLRELQLTPGSRTPEPGEDPLPRALATFMATDAPTPNGHPAL